jgi:hypothetical protein
MPKDEKNTPRKKHSNEELFAAAIHTTRREEVYLVPASDGVYEVVESSRGFLMCQCKGYFFRHTCRHIEVVKLIENLIRQWGA